MLQNGYVFIYYIAENGKNKDVVDKIRQWLAKIGLLSYFDKASNEQTGLEQQLLLNVYVAVGQFSPQNFHRPIVKFVKPQVTKAQLKGIDGNG